ncbi:hypothetical protein [Rhizobium rhizosphaerae]|nr:hypothetical protein [Xaviernesmea rhizosphaerae]
MADFVAVIRRTVDGLSDNSPEMRARVYEKARGAVRRQLEGMKPRPSDDMIQRQMTKLEAAITDVESDFSEAVVEEAPLEEAAVEEVVAAQDVSADQPIAEPEPAAETQHEADPAHGPAPSQAYPAAEDHQTVADQQGPVDEPPADAWAAPASDATAPDAVTHEAAVQHAAAADDAARAEDELAQGAPTWQEAPAETAPAYENQPAAGHDAPAPIADHHAYDPVEAGPVDGYVPIEQTEAAAEDAPAGHDADSHEAVASYDEATPSSHWQDEPHDVSQTDHSAWQAHEDAVRARAEDHAAQEAYVPHGDLEAVHPAEHPLEPAEPATGWDAHPAAAEPWQDPHHDAGHQAEEAPSWPESVSHPAGDAAADDAARALAEEYDDLSGATPAPVFETRDHGTVAMPAAADLQDVWAAPARPLAPEVYAPEPHTAERHTSEFHATEAYAPEPAPDHARDNAQAVASAEDDAAAALAQAYGRETDDPAAQAASDKAQAANWELPEWTASAGPVHAHVEPEWHQSAGHVDYAVEPDAVIIPAPASPATATGAEPVTAQDNTQASAAGWSWDDKDPFAAAPDGEKRAAPEEKSDEAIGWAWPVEAQPADPKVEAEQQNWEAIDALLSARGVTPEGVVSPAAVAEAPIAPARPISYRAEPKPPRFSIKKAVSLLVLLGLLGGGGYAYWSHRDVVDGWVSKLMASASVPAPSQAPGNGTAANGGGQGATTDTAAVINKFTQRLQADGSEVDEGVAPAAGRSTADEGRSVSPQTEASKPVETAQASPVPTPGSAAPAATGSAAPADAPAPAAPPSATTPAGTPATVEVPAGAQKMFLYEERLGQAAPTAIEGSVAWTLKEETPDGANRPEPVIQAQITVPNRGLTALMTIKRNSDTSLPASHVIEFVFSLPANFEGGSIAGVQRVSMKRTEQDRGDALIGVPAKITDDFHMIALNDFPEAVKTNLDLLANRSWIDIPLTYRNGRRALLTLDKGSAGADAFTRALKTWAAIKPSAG